MIDGGTALTRLCPPYDSHHWNVNASRICTMRNKLMHECALFDLALALTSTYL